MCEVIDTFVGDAEGLWAVLASVSQGLPSAGEMITVIRPDGTQTQAEIAELDVRHGGAAIRFAALNPEDLPCHSRIVRDSHAVRAALEKEIVAAWSGIDAPSAKITAHRCPECDEIAEFFESRRWQDLRDVNELRYHEVALALFTPQAFHYYLPAFMLATLRDPRISDIIPDGIMSNLEREFQDSERPRLRLFNSAQRRALARFLRTFHALQSGEIEDVELMALMLESSI